MIANIYWYEPNLGKPQKGKRIVVEFDKLIDTQTENGERDLTFMFNDKPIHCFCVGDKTNPFRIFLMENGKTFDTIVHRMDEV